MKKILSTALAIVLFIGASQAQTTGESSNHKHAHGGAKMKDLNLTADQKAKLKTIREAEKTEMQAMKNSGATGTDKEARKALHEKYGAQFQAVLTDEQKAKWNEERKEGRSNNTGDNRHASFGKDLHLSSEQQAKLSAINNDYKNQMQALKNNTSLPEDQKKVQLVQLAKAHRASLQGVLTQEQLLQMQQARRSHKDNSSNSSNL